MPFHIEKKHPSLGTIYYSGNYQWHQKKENRMIYETEECACCECGHVLGTIVEETE